MAETRWEDWPSDLDPAGAAIHSYNELAIDAAPDSVWAWLVRADLWPSFYSNAKRVRIREGPDARELALGTRFSWITFGVPVTTTVEVCEPPRRLAWRGDAYGSAAFHTWLLEPAGDGCHAVTEEAQNGLIPRLARPLMSRGLTHFHQRWLEGLARVARGGPPAG